MFTLLFLGIFLINLFLFQNAIAGGVLFLAAALFYGKLLAYRLSPGHAWFGILSFLSTLICAGSITYYLLPFTAETALGVFLFCLPVWIGWSKRGQTQKNDPPSDEHKLSPLFWIASTLVAAGITTGVWLILSGATIQAIRTPWDQISSMLFLLVFSVLLLLSSLLFSGRGKSIVIILASGMLFLFLSVALFVYPLGYGFDTFIHQATESHIASFGSIEPKPLYYTGQYVLVLLTHHLFFLPVAVADKFLVPLLAALLLPSAWYHAALRLLHSKRAAIASLIGLFLLPLSSWIVTTPQGLANLFVLLTVLASVPTLLTRENPKPWHLLLPTTATLLIHPLAGIPLLLYLALIFSRSSQADVKHITSSRSLSWIIFAFACIALPVSFLAQTFLSKQPTSFDWSHLWHLQGMETLISLFSFHRVFSPLLDGVYSFGAALPLFLGALALGTWLWHRKDLNSRLRPLGYLAIALFLNYVFLSTAAEFTFLIEYERANYADRLLPLLLFFLTPFVIAGLGLMTDHLKNRPLSLRTGFLILLCTLATANLYLTYPRDDAFVVGHNINTSQTDMDAVRLIQKEAEGRSYLVLANQAVSAAAMITLGFENQYFGSQYRYPIPTGGALYSFFLSMNEQPSRETAIQAAQLANGFCLTDETCEQTSVEVVYFVVNTYWWDAARIIETAKTSSDAWMSVEGKNYVFRYEME
jgi:hypothetical protein